MSPGVNATTTDVMPATPAGDETTTWLGALARSTQSAPECVAYNSEDL
jgi:hypothetical protein